MNGIINSLTTSNDTSNLNVDDHGLLSLQMIKELCGDSDKVGKRLLLIARESLRMRIELWNSINGLLINREKQLELQVS